MYRGIRISRLRVSGSSFVNNLSVPHFRRKALKSWSNLEETYFSIKDLFERHKVVFTVSTSVASVLTAWAGYTLRHHHESKVEQRLESIEKAMKGNDPMEDPELKKLVSRTVSYPACIATAGTSLIIGYCLGWRGGAWYAKLKLRREQMKLEQMKLAGQIKPKRWQLKSFIRQLKLFKRPLIRPKQASGVKTIEHMQQDAASIAKSGANCSVR